MCLLFFLIFLFQPIVAKESFVHPLLEDYPLSLDTWEPLEKKGDQFEIQSKSDVTIALHTLFPTEKGAERVDQEERFEEAKEKANILARFLMILQQSPLHLVTEDQNKKGIKGSLWPYPLATVLGHGQRVLITMPGVKVEKALSWLFTGETINNKFPSFVKKRAISSHGVTKKNGRLEEVQVDNVIGVSQSLLKGVYGQHLYINMPWGGLGEIGPDGLLNDFSGKRYSPSLQNRDDNTKLGHFYVYWDEIDGTAILLIGIETCSPGAKNPYGVKHSIKSGMSDVSKNRSVNGGSKWKILLPPEKSPSFLGGMCAELTVSKLEDVQKEWEQYCGYSDQEKAYYMIKLLENNNL